MTEQQEYFDTEQDALRHKEAHQLTQRVPEFIQGRGKWALVFPISAHLQVVLR